MTQITLERDHEVVPIPGSLEPGVVIITPDLCSFFIISCPDWESDHPRVAVARGTPGPFTRGVGTSTRRVVGAEYPFEQGKRLVASLLLAAAVQVA